MFLHMLHRIAHINARQHSYVSDAKFLYTNKSSHANDNEKICGFLYVLPK